MAVSHLTVTGKPTTELHQIAIRLGELAEREVRALGFQDEDLDFVIIVTRNTGDDSRESGMVSTVDLEELVLTLHHNLEAILGPEAMQKYAELERGRTS